MIATLSTQRSAIDKAMFDSGAAAPDLAKLSMTDLMKRRAEIEKALEAAEADWLEANEWIEGEDA